MRKNSKLVYLNFLIPVFQNSDALEHLIENEL